MATPHPSVSGILRYFEYSHLPPVLRGVSSRFHALAWALVEEEFLEGPELTVALRKLLESKDAAVRAALDKMPEEG
ncbi:hypothetical protein [Streptomyces sp. NBC_00258]|uniref:hypothetical protein n=1 Tax=Streptomyces sp. NBC_00258 TaxID=2903642 RepID=UPI002E2DCCE1|nr:hypothetical protein [Streptomyces sp. NBC_00258]